MEINVSTELAENMVQCHGVSFVLLHCPYNMNLATLFKIIQWVTSLEVHGLFPFKTPCNLETRPLKRLRSG
jgi:hypothetical protein